MINIKNEFPKPRFWHTETLKNIERRNVDKEICFLVWSNNYSIISKQLDYAMSIEADIIVSEIYPYELPEITSLEQYHFFQKRFLFLGPDSGVKFIKNSNLPLKSVDIVWQSDSKNLLNNNIVRILNKDKLFNIHILECKESKEYVFKINSNSLHLMISDLSLKKAIIQQANKENIQISLTLNEEFKSLNYLFHENGESPIIFSNRDSLRSEILKFSNIKHIEAPINIEFSCEIKNNIYNIDETRFSIPLYDKGGTLQPQKYGTLSRFIKNYAVRIIKEQLIGNSSISFNTKLFLKDWFIDILNSFRTPYAEIELIYFFEIAGSEKSLELIQDYYLASKYQNFTMDDICFLLLRHIFIDYDRSEKRILADIFNGIVLNDNLFKSQSLRIYYKDFLHYRSKSNIDIINILKSFFNSIKTIQTKDKVFKIFALKFSLIELIDLFENNEIICTISLNGFIEVLKDKFSILGLFDIYNLNLSNDIHDKMVNLVKKFKLIDISDNIWTNSFLIKFSNSDLKLNFVGLNPSAKLTCIIGLFLKYKLPLNKIKDLNLIQSYVKNQDSFSELSDLYKRFDSAQYSKEDRNYYLLYKYLIDKESLDSLSLSELECNISFTNLNFLRNNLFS